MITMNNYRCHPLSLEEEFENEHIREVNVAENCGFEDYLIPNEEYPISITEHLEESQIGVHVSSGGPERIFFNLIFNNTEKCEGIVLRDINPKVKAYVDFNTALIRIAKTRQEYNEWAAQEILESTKLTQIITDISTKIMNASMPQKVKDYYLKNAISFGEIYLRVDKSWRSKEYFQVSAYDQNEEQFQKIKRYADAGNIISTIGQINDLLFLKKRNIAVVDTSNILDYSFINLQGNENFQPRVIWTKVGSPALYYSYIHSALNEKERDKLEKLIEKIRRICWDRDSDFSFPIWINKGLRNLDALNKDVGAIYSINTLKALEKFATENLLDVYPNDIHMTGKGLKLINCIGVEELENLCKSKEVIKFIPRLVKCSAILEPKVSLAFSKMEEWKMEFENYYNTPLSPLEAFLEILEKGKVLEEFTQNIGNERLENLKNNHQNAYDQYLKNLRESRRNRPAIK